MAARVLGKEGGPRHHHAHGLGVPYRHTANERANRCHEILLKPVCHMGYSLHYARNLEIHRHSMLAVSIEAGLVFKAITVDMGCALQYAAEAIYNKGAEGCPFLPMLLSSLSRGVGLVMICSDEPGGCYLCGGDACPRHMSEGPDRAWAWFELFPVRDASTA
eukprot:6301463-Amphidinium_carterae.2